MQQFPYIAAVFLLIGVGSALVIAADLRSCRQPMRIMNWVWILTGLWAGVFALKAYYAFGRARRCNLAEREKREGTAAHETSHAGTADRTRSAHESGAMTTHAQTAAGQMDSMDMEGMRSERTAVRKETMAGIEMPGTEIQGMDMQGTNMSGMDMPGMNMPGMNMPGMEPSPAKPRWQSVVLSTLHCGAGCTLADLVGEWFLYFVPVAIGGSLVAGSWVVDYLLALVFGIGFQYAAIRGMEPKTPRSEVVRRAAKADILSLTAWQAGMYGWMAVVIFVLNGGAMLPRTSLTFWFMMQIAMAFGFVVSLPVNVLLIRKGIKHAM